MSKDATRTLQRLADDLAIAARITQVPFSEATILEALRSFDEGFLHGSVQIRTTTHPVERRELCFRYLDLESGRNPLEIALASGTLKPTGHPIFGWLDCVEERMPVLGYGADFEVSHGLVKIWTFLAGAFDPRAFLDLPLVPRGLKASIGVLQDLQLEHVTIVGVDFARGSVNLYFDVYRARFDLLARACARLGFAAPSDAAQEHAAKARCMGVTYAWDQPQIERLCFYVPDFARHEVPAYHPHLCAYAEGAPALVEDPRFILGWSHGRGGTYFKLEDDYTGDVNAVFQAAMGVPRIPYVVPVRREGHELVASV